MIPAFEALPASTEVLHPARNRGLQDDKAVGLRGPWPAPQALPASAEVLQPVKTAGFRMTRRGWASCLVRV